MRLFRAADFDISIFTSICQPAANTSPTNNLDLASLDGEQWRDIVGYEGSYQISSLGRVKSLERTILAKNGQRQHIRSRILKPVSRSYNGYPTVALNDGKTRLRYIHDLMLTAFVGARPDGMECRHLNDIPTDNRLENLWVKSESRWIF